MKRLAIIISAIVLIALVAIVAQFTDNVEASIIPEGITKVLINSDGLRANVHNQMSFNHESLWTFNGNQYATFADSSGHVIVAKRSLPSGEWSTQDTGKTVNTADLHNTTNLGIDPDGYIHVIYDCHVTDITSNVRYIKSTNAEDISSWTDQASGMTGSNEDEFTYPTFFSDGTNLYCFYRNGGGYTANWYLNKYTHGGTPSWGAVQHPLLSADGTRRPYLEGIAVDGNGYFHLFWCYREGLDVGFMNAKISYAKSEDKGTTWKKSTGDSYSLPIAYSAAEVIDDVGEDDGLLNSNEVCVDSNNIPHMVYYKVDEGDYFNYYHIWLNGSNWATNRVTEFTHATGTGYLPYGQPGVGDYGGSQFPNLPLSRPIVVASDTDIIVLYTHPTVTSKVYAAKASTPYTSWAFYKLDSDIWGTCTELNVDKQYWASEGELHILLSAADLEEGSVPVYSVETTPSNWSNSYTFDEMYAPMRITTHNNKSLMTEDGKYILTGI